MGFLATALMTALLIASATAAEPAPPESVEGVWQREVKTADGLVRVVKEHRQGKTVVTAKDEQGNVLYQHRSEYRVERSGKVSVLTFSNRTVTDGPGKGQVTKDPVSFIYRVKGDQFIEVRGVLDEDPEAPGLVKWKRVERGNDAA
jgi:hypothetical protein